MAQKTRSQLRAAISANYPDNTSGAITPEILRNVSGDAADSAFFMLNGAYIMVETSDDPIENGHALIDAYSAASALTPGGNPIAQDNQVSVIIPPGVYEFENVDGEWQTLGLLNNFVNLVGLTRNPDDVLITSACDASNSGTVVVVANFAAISGVTIRNNGNTRVSTDNTDACALCVGVGGAGITYRDCKFIGGSTSWPMRQGITIDSVFLRCTSDAYGFGANGGDFSGQADTCTGADNCFAHSATVKNGSNLINCVAGQNSFGQAVEGEAYLVNCRGDSNSFGYTTFVGNAWNCRSGANSFGRTNSLGRCYNCWGIGNECFGGNGGLSNGYFYNCVAGAGSFGGVAGEFAGRAFNCFSGDVSFGGNSDGTFSGVAINCAAGAGSFGHGGSFTGTLINAVLANIGNPNSSPTPWSGAWAPADFSGKVVDTTFEPTGADENCVTLPDGATGTFDRCTFVPNGAGFVFGIVAAGSATIKVRYCLLDSTSVYASGVTNLYNSGYNDAAGQNLFPQSE